ncbi:hypothetical protein P5673_024194 [Acropora cervicornis]|uniref:Uncharacterized protein n=1 Tax=Acropora cervicornis TaxID=6130 RepID=A0AAD9UYE2_ACRCE|nr:hypothetical protein P5673_024194 [Acropora cervicornis]
MAHEKENKKKLKAKIEKPRNNRSRHDQLESAVKKESHDANILRGEFAEENTRLWQDNSKNHEEYQTYRKKAFAVERTSIMNVTLTNAMKETVVRQSMPAMIPALAMAEGRARTPTPTRRLKRKIAAT